MIKAKTREREQKRGGGEFKKEGQKEQGRRRRSKSRAHRRIAERNTRVIGQKEVEQGRR